MKWFRFYSEVLEDEKVQTISVELRWSWVCILCLANEGEPRGVLPSLKRIAFRMRITEKKAQAVIDALVAERLLDRLGDGTLKPHNWDARQRKSDDVTDRVTKHRNAQKNPSHVTLHETGLQRSLERNSLCATETDSETDSEPPTPTGGLSVSGPAAKTTKPAAAVADADVNRCQSEASRLWPPGGHPFANWIPQWLADGHSAPRVCAAFRAAADAGAASAKYVQRILDSPERPNGRASPPGPAPDFTPTPSDPAAMAFYKSRRAEIPG